MRLTQMLSHPILMLLGLQALQALQAYGTPIGTTDYVLLSADTKPPRSLPEPAEISSRQWVNCEDDLTNYDSSCWNTLDLSNYLPHWVTTTPPCNGDAADPRMDGSGCCNPEEAWAKCFLRLARGSNDQDCSVVDDQKCASDIKLAPELIVSTHHQVRYVEKNIHEINDFFFNHFNGMRAISNPIQAF